MRRLLVTAFASSLVVGLAGSCVEDDGSVFIEGALPLDPAAECKAVATGVEFVFNGTLDVLTPHTFQTALKVVTNLPATFNNTDVTGGDQRAPNYPDYGSTDNNVIIFDSAVIEYSFVAAALKGAVTPSAGFECDAQGLCVTKDGKGPVVQVAGSIFNKQTTLNSPAVVLVEAISAATAEALNTDLKGTLTDPSQRVRVVATIRLNGSTTGNAGLRDITTFPFPFPIDVCRGCLTPNATFCTDEFTADFVATPQLSCGIGQDVQQGVCLCNFETARFDDLNGNGRQDAGEPSGNFVTNPGTPVDSADGCQ